MGFHYTVINALARDIAGIRRHFAALDGDPQSDAAVRLQLAAPYLEGQDAVDVCWNEFRHSTLLRRQTASLCLAWLGAHVLVFLPDAGRVLCAVALEDQDLIVRCNALIVLKRAAAREALPVLEQIIQREVEDKTVIRHAKDALAWIAGIHRRAR